MLKTQAQHSPATEKNVVGFDSLNAAAMSRHAQALRLFLRLGVSFNGRPGVGSRKARRCRTGLSTRTLVAHPFDSGRVVQNHLRRNTMTQQALIERRSFSPRPASFTELPFVADLGRGRNKRRSFWNVPPTDDYGHANDVGRQYAADFVQYLKQNPFWVGSGTLGTLIEDMAQHPRGEAMHGYAVGFFAFLEQLLYVAANSADHYAIAERDAQRYAAILAARETEAEGEAA